MGSVKSFKGFTIFLSAEFSAESLKEHSNVNQPDMPFIRRRFPELKEEDMLKPTAIAHAYWFIAHQDRSAWTHELDLRPFKEKF